MSAFGSSGVSPSGTATASVLQFEGKMSKMVNERWVLGTGCAIGLGVALGAWLL